MEYLLRELVRAVMSGAPETEIEEAVQRNFEPVAENLRKRAPEYLADHPDLVERLNHVLLNGIRYMRQRGDFAHSTWILDADPAKPPGWDTRLHIKSDEVWWVGEKAFESLANQLGVTSVKLMELTNEIIERREGST